MSLRGIQQLIIHLQSFRNIQLWYQGLYFLKIQLFSNNNYKNTNQQTIYAHPFAHTQNYHPYQQSKRYYDSQIIRTASIQDQTSTFISKMFILKYFQQEVDINDIVHFRIQTPINQLQIQMKLQVSLMFFDCVTKKKQKPQELALKEAKVARMRQFSFKLNKRGIHQFCPILFDQHYFCLINLSFHSICLDYRFRTNKMQLSEFAKLTYQDKLKLIQKNKKQQSQPISYYKSIINDLKLQDCKQSIYKIQNIVLNQIKQTYFNLLNDYSFLFSKVITQYEKKVFSGHIIPPSNLVLFQSQQKVINSKTNDDNIFIKYKTKKPQEIIQKILNQVNIISSQLMKLWYAYIDLYKINPRFCFAILQDDYLKLQKQFWQKLIINNKFTVKQLAQSKSFNQTAQQNQLIQQKLKIEPGFHLLDQNLFGKRDNIPIFIQNSYHIQGQLKIMSQSVSSGIQNELQIDGIHLIVFVHGFQGNSFDMRLIKNYVSYMYPQSMFLCAASNEDMTDNDIFQMGQRLANQIKSFIIQNFPNNTLGKISFMGHSLGGVKIRAALPKLLEYKDRFHAYISFSSPHLGYGYNTSSVIGAGIWVLKKMKNSECLKQLSMTDSEIPQQTCLYRLSQTQGMQHFKHIFLFSSKQDSYAPFESARIQIHPSFISQQDKHIQCRMAKNILRNVKSGVLKRINVIFKIQQKNIDSIIGRTAHIMFLQSHQIMRALLFTQPNLFA